MMIMSFSVPDNKKYAEIIRWYKNADKQERSMEFRKIFLSYLKTQDHIVETKVSHISPERNVKIDRINIIPDSTEEDLDSKLDFIGVFGGDGGDDQ